MQSYLRRILPHLGVVLVFVIASIAYFNPVLQGKKIFQSDIVQYIGMAKQQNDFRAETGEETYWTDAAFGGMPTYQLGAHYPNNYIKKLDLTLRFLPRPADYLFLYFIGMYVLLLVMRIDFRLAFLGALAFGFSTYLIIILGVGHNAKAHAIAYMPLVLSGILLTFRGKYLWGFLLLTVSMGLELVANHLQMTYYLLLLVIIIGIVYFIDAYKKQKLPKYFKAIGVMVVAVVIAVGLNATNLLATQEYAETSTRGNTGLTINPDGSPKEHKSGLDYDYITEYSYGKLETFNLFIPRFMGGSSTEELPKDSHTFDALIRIGASPQEASQIANQVPMYWGDQTFVGAPAYLGAVVVFLAILALFLIRGRFKWWAVSGLVLTLLLSWGRNFPALTNFFIEYVPLYNKFRAVSSIQVIVELIVPMLAVVGLHHFFFKPRQLEEKKKALVWSFGIAGGIAVLFLLFRSTLFDYASPYDSMFREQLGLPVVEAIRKDRMALLTSDTLRSLIFVVLTATVLWYAMQAKLKQSVAFIALALLIVVDLVGVDRRYVDEDAFVQARVMNQPFQKNGANIQILEDDGHYRVYDATRNAFNSAEASYFHNALGGYHAAKPGRIQDLFDFYISKGDVGILNMMNVRYFIIQNENGGPIAQRNPFANGNAWFVENIQPAEDANEEILLLDGLETKTTAVVNKEFIPLIPSENIERDSLATIDLYSYQPNHLVYETASKTPQVAVFSENYYPKGWHAYINGEPATYFRANYVLRAMVIPPGNNKVEFKFEPEVIQTGSTIALLSSVLFLLLAASGIFFVLRKQDMKSPSIHSEES